MKLSKLGILGLISLLSYTAMVVFSPLAYPGYDWMKMAVSELSAVGAPSADLANRLNSLFGPCALVSIMAVCVAVANNPSKRFRFGVYCFAAMLIGPIGTGLLPASVFGLFERLGTFSVVVFNAVLGMYLFSGKLEAKNE